MKGDYFHPDLAHGPARLRCCYHTSALPTCPTAGNKRHETEKCLKNREEIVVTSLPTAGEVGDKESCAGVNEIWCVAVCMHHSQSFYFIY